MLRLSRLLSAIAVALLIVSSGMVTDPVYAGPPKSGNGQPSGGKPPVGNPPNSRPSNRYKSPPKPTKNVPSSLRRSETRQPPPGTGKPKPQISRRIESTGAAREAIAANSKWIGKRLDKHWKDHRSDTGSLTVGNYNLNARNTIREGKEFDYVYKGQPRIGYYNHATGHFVSTSHADGVVRIHTYYRLHTPANERAVHYQNGDWHKLLGLPEQ